VPKKKKKKKRVLIIIQTQHRPPPPPPKQTALGLNSLRISKSTLVDFKLWDKDGQLGVYCHYAMSLLVLIFHNKNLSFIYLFIQGGEEIYNIVLLTFNFLNFYLPKSSFGERRA
jgi:hypothetical protein